MLRRKITQIALFILSVSFISPGFAATNEDQAGPEVGQKAPDFKLPYATQEKIEYNPEKGMSLSQYRGKIVVLAFYPADWSSGCTNEVCTLRDTFRDLDSLGAVILGISGDYVFSHHEWAKHHNLKFPLLSDHDHAVAKAYASFMGPPLMYNKRTIYVIDGEGIVRYRDLDLQHDSKADYDAVKASIDKLKAN
jgi:peroxiredoxin Q/BCP